MHMHCCIYMHLNITRGMVYISTYIIYNSLYILCIIILYSSAPIISLHQDDSNEARHTPDAATPIKGLLLLIRPNVSQPISRLWIRGMAQQKYILTAHTCDFLH